MKFNADTLFSAVAMATNQTSQIVDITNVALISLQTIVANAAAPTGTLAIQFSNDKINWAPDTTVVPPVVTANGVSIQNIPNMGHLWMRLLYAAGAGSGNLTAILGTKGV